MRDPYDVLGVSKSASAGGHQERLSASSPRSCTPTPTRTTRRRPRKFAELNAAYEIVGDEDKRKAFDRGEIDAEGKPRFQGFEGAGGGRPGGRRLRRRRAHFETFTWGPDGIQRSRRPRRGGGCRRRRHRRHPAATCSAARAAARRGAQFEPDDFERRAAPRRAATSPRTRDDHARRKLRQARRAACSCRPARRSRSRFRPASPTARQIRLKGQGMPGPAARPATR